MALADNIIAYWKLDESSGDAADSVGGFTLTNNNTTPYVAALINNGADVESASSQSLSRADHITGNTTNISFGGWLNAESWVDGATMFCNGVGGGFGQGYMLQQIVTGGNNRLRIDISFVAAINSTSNLSTGTWVHVMATRGASTWNIYVNGASEATGTNNPFGLGTDSDTVLGARKNGGGGFDSYYDGILDEWGFWTRELSGAEVSELYNGGSGLSYPFTSASAIRNLTLLGVG